MYTPLWIGWTCRWTACRGTRNSRMSSCDPPSRHPAPDRGRSSPCSDCIVSTPAHLTKMQLHQYYKQHKINDKKNCKQSVNKLSFGAVLRIRARIRIILGSWIRIRINAECWIRICIKMKRRKPYRIILEHWKFQIWGKVSGRIRIRIKLKGRIRIRIRVKGIRIRINVMRIRNTDPEY